MAPGDCYLAGEPILINNPDCANNAVMLCQEYLTDTDSGAVVIFDAAGISERPIARLPLRSPERFGSHAAFVSGRRRDGTFRSLIQVPEAREEQVLALQ